MNVAGVSKNPDITLNASGPIKFVFDRNSSSFRRRFGFNRFVLVSIDFSVLERKTDTHELACGLAD